MLDAEMLRVVILNMVMHANIRRCMNIEHIWKFPIPISVPTWPLPHATVTSAASGQQERSYRQSFDKNSVCPRRNLQVLADLIGPSIGSRV